MQILSRDCVAQLLRRGHNDIEISERKEDGRLDGAKRKTITVSVGRKIVKHPIRVARAFDTYLYAKLKKKKIENSKETRN